MPRSTLISRRDLLKVAALVGGGLAIGVGRSIDGLADPAPETSFEPNAWIRIHGDGRIELAVARSEMGQGVMTALPMLIAEELEVPLARLRVSFAPAAPAYTNRLIGEQATAFSTSVREAWLPLREAGAAARDLLIRAAALTWKVPAGECRADDGRVVHGPTQRSLDYGALAAMAATLPLPDSVTLKEAHEWTLIGTAQRRLDTPDKVSGRAQFGVDVRLPGMVYASIERCPFVDGRARRWSTVEAKASPGVIDAIKVPSGIAVVARDTWSALRGRKALTIDWEPRPRGRLDSAQLWRRFRKALDRGASRAESVGRTEQALAEAPKTLEGVYEVPFQAHACMEPMSCTAVVADGRCDVYVPTQAQTRTLETARRLTGLPVSRIAVHTTYLGGGFGRRGEQDFVAEAIDLAKRLKRPVQVVWTREDDIRHDFYRPMSLHRLRGALDAEGNLVAWHHRIVAPSILARLSPAAVRDGIDPTSVAGAVQLPYGIPNVQVDYRRADTAVPVGFWRSSGHSHNAYVVECFLDELARAAGRDPLEMRRALLASKPRHLLVLNTAASQAGWDKPAEAGHARGLALAESSGTVVAQVAEISIEAGHVRIHRVVCAVDCGQVVNPETVRAQIRGGVVFGLTAALKGSITLAGGRVAQGNFDDYPLLRADECPSIDVHIVRSDEAPGGVGEAGTPPIAPAVANAVFAATGTPVRALPIRLPPETSTRGRAGATPADGSDAGPRGGAPATPPSSGQGAPVSNPAQPAPQAPRSPGGSPGSGAPGDSRTG